MIIERVLQLSVINPGRTYSQIFDLYEDVTVLMNNDIVYAGKIEDIKKDELIIVSKDRSVYSLKFNNIKQIENTEWLAGTDIREV